MEIKSFTKELTMTLVAFWTERWKLGVLVLGGWFAFCFLAGVFALAAATNNHRASRADFDPTEREEARRTLAAEVWNVAHHGSSKAKDLADRAEKEMDLQDAGPELVTKENYNRIHPGMRFDEVCGKFGLKYDLQSQIQNHRTFVFETRRGFGKVILTFDGSRLISKHSFGL